MDRHRISSDELKSEKLHIWYLASVENPWNRRALIASGKTPKPLFQNRDLKAITIRQSVITNLLKQKKDLRVVQVFAGLKKPSSTERYRQTGLEELKAAVLKHHPFWINHFVELNR
jgi:hypothetical protein